MLLYNQRKEFVGIDEDDLNSLGFQSIAELQNESHDFADLFVKKPGYIHNFKNFSWIDFILHSETDESKAIVHAKGVNYSCALHITPFHFSGEESGYAIFIRNIRALKGAEDAQATKDLEAAGGIQASPAPVAPSVAPVTPAPAAVNSEPAPELDISLDDIQMNEPESVPLMEEPAAEPELPNFEPSFQQELSEPDPLDVPEPQEIDLDLASPPVENNLNITENEFGAPIENDFGAPADIDYGAPLDIGEDLMLDDPTPEPSFEEAPVVAEPEAEPAKKEEAPMLGDYVSTPVEGSEHLSELIQSGDYTYDPNVAADELGLPVDLIEEFIGDFIDQAHEFKDDLFASINAGDFDNVQVLSHKLKGVAANLRVEDAFDVLSVVNTSKDKDEILPNLTHFYKIIAKLEGKEVVEEAAVAAPTPAPEPMPEPTPEPLAIETESAPEDDYAIDIKQPDDAPMLIDEEVQTAASHDDIYDDLLATPAAEEEMPLAPAPEPAAPSLDNDLYDDLLTTPELDTNIEPEFEAPLAAPELEDDLYDDLLASAAPQEEAPVIPEPAAPELAATPSVPEINFDAQSSANQLGIPVDIVNEFVQEFKQQVSSHQIDFDNALAAQDIKQVNATATLLKGMSDNLRLTEISEVLKELQSETNINNTADAIAKVHAYADQL